MLVSKRQSCKTFTVNKLVTQKYFKIYYDGDVHFAKIHHDFERIVLEIVDTCEKIPLEWKNGVLYLKSEQLTVFIEDSIMDATPKCWPNEIIWPPAFDTFNFSKNFSSIVSFEKHKKICLRYQNTHSTQSFYDICFSCDSDEEHGSFSCACNQCNLKTFKASRFVLKNEYGIPRFRLSGIYENLFKITEDGLNYKKYAKLSNANILSHVLKAFYADQECLWKKVIALESRNKQVTISSLWLRICIHMINEEIKDCLSFIEYHDVILKKKQKKKEDRYFRKIVSRNG